jgi:hypothetical protein
MLGTVTQVTVTSPNNAYVAEIQGPEAEDGVVDDDVL